jgi:ankyrin repeat protein
VLVENCLFLVTFLLLSSRTMDPPQEVTSNPHQEFIDALDEGNYDDAQKLLDANPTLNFNSVSCAPLVLMCFTGNINAVKWLLSRPQLDPNHRDQTSHTPLHMACEQNHPEIVRLLARDPRVEINPVTIPSAAAESEGYTALSIASYYGNLKCVQYLMIFGRGLELGKKEAARAANVIAFMMGQDSVFQLLIRFNKNSQKQRYKLMIELQEHEAMAADLLSMVLFIIEGLLNFRNKDTNATGFFKMVLKLPLELQMIVCLRAVGSMKSGISAKDVDVAARYLVSVLV